jgi:hypothetical protein
MSQGRAALKPLNLVIVSKDIVEDDVPIQTVAAPGDLRLPDGVRQAASFQIFAQLVDRRMQIDLSPLRVPAGPNFLAFDRLKYFFVDLNHGLSLIIFLST